MAAKVAAAARARRVLVIVARTYTAASEGLDGAVARGKLYMEAGADAIFPEALNTAEMFRVFAERMPGVPLLAT
jgi:methylisocitrate lyase